MNLLTGPFGYSHGSIYLGEALGGSPNELRMGAQHGYDVPISMFDGTMGLIGRVIRTGQPALVPDLHAQDGTYRLAAFSGDDPKSAYLGAEIRPGEGAAGRAIRNRAPVLDHAHDRRRFPAATAEAQAPNVMASLAVPPIRDQVVVGAISLVRFDTAHPFSELELEVVQMLGATVALAITNAELHAAVMEASIRDPLTGTFNRRHFEPSLERMIGARRLLPLNERPPIAAILFDLDLFGAFNKFHGHQTGDAVLRAFGKLLRERFRAGDLVARYGGEEFVAILDGTGQNDAVRIAEEVRAAFAKQSFRGASGERLSATVSAGCAELGQEDGASELLGACDVGLAMAKGAGRNQVVAA
jgi:diguanylate cyclase (GGDEF)-like protein